MSARRPRRNNNEPNPPKKKMSVLTIAFAIAMAFFLVIGMVAVGVTEFIGGNDDPPAAQGDLGQNMDQQSESEEDQLRDRIDQDPEDFQAHQQLGVLLGNTGRVDEAIPHYEAALQGDPENTALRLSFARMLEQREYDLDAEIQLERVLEEESDNVEAMYLLAEINERKQPPQQEEAEEFYRQVIETDPDSFYAQMAEERLAAHDEPADQDTGSSETADDDADTD
jgi:cytochrome c-type biogenesis protein CcmH/NrfG